MDLYSYPQNHMHHFTMRRNKTDGIINPSNPGDKCNTVDTSRHYAVVTLRCEDHTEHEYETIPNVQDAKPKNKTSSAADHYYDDTINIKCDNVLVKDSCTSKEGTKAHNINQQSSASKTASTLAK